MTAKIIDGRKLSKEINHATAKRVQQLNQNHIFPKLVVVLVGEDPGSQLYVRMKNRKAKKLGIQSDVKHLPDDTSEDTVLKLIDRYNQDNSIDGILVQSPLPEQINEDHVISRIDPEKDADGASPFNVGRLAINDEGSYPIACTARGIMTMFKQYQISLKGKNALVIGRSKIVGRPMVNLLMNENAQVTNINKFANDTSAYTRKADIIISATGKCHLLNKNNVKPGAIIIDVGQNRDENDKLVGDADFDDLSSIASYITPVPGGVGPMTIATLMEQTVEDAVRRHK